MPEEDIEVSVGLIADVEELERQLESGEFEADVDMGGTGGGRGGGGAAGGVLGGGLAGRAFAGGGATTLLGIGAVVGVLGAILSQLEPIKELMGFLVRQVELFIIPFLRPLTPLLNDIAETIAKVIQFTRDPTGFLTSGPEFERAGRVVGQGSRGAGSALGMAGRNIANLVAPGTPFLLELSDEAKKENMGGFLENVLDDFW